MIGNGAQATWPSACPGRLSATPEIGAGEVHQGIETERHQQPAGNAVEPDEDHLRNHVADEPDTDRAR